MSLQEAINRILSRWMKGSGPDNDIVIGSRIRLARNLNKIPFPAVASDEQLAHVVDLVRSVVKRERSLADMDYLILSEVPRLERELLVEKHVVSPQHIKNVRHRAVVLRRDESVSVMVNEEDHLRIQTIYPGFQLEKAWEECTRVDDAFESQLDFAFSPEYGYLTACPTNLGTGLRASVMVHLPVLTMTDQMKRVVSAINKFGLAVRGLYGEGTDVLGNIYQISNQVTLGHSETEIIQHLVNVVRQIISQERQARQQLVAAKRLELEDKTYRSLGILSQARRISSHEAMQLLSDVRLGIDLNLIRELQPRILQELLVLIRPAHLQKIMGRDMEAPERDVYRASLIRERIRLGLNEDNSQKREGEG